ncbi:MAG: hypothetical protein ACRCX2_07285 [Paraclostridium sp.]
MAHKNYGGVSHTNTGYNNHTNTGGYSQSGYNNHTNTGGYSQGGYNNHSNYANHANYGNHTNTGYSRGYNNGYNQDYNQYKQYSQYSCSGTGGCCRDRLSREDFLNKLHSGVEKKNFFNARAYFQSGNHTNTGGYTQSGGYTKSGYNNHTNYENYAQSGYNNHTNYTNYARSGGNTHANTGYTNHVNTTTNNPPSNPGKPDRGSAVYYKDSIRLTWPAASDVPAYPVEIHTPALQNGFVHWGAPWAPVKVWKTKEGNVYIRGLINAAPGPGKVIFNLPAGWRPTGGHLIFGSQEVDKHARINIANNGNVEFVNTKYGANRSWLNLNLCFNADPNGWKAMPLMNRWTNYSPVDNSWQQARYKTTGTGITFVEGLITGGANGVVGQLPDGSGPAGRLIRLTDSTNETCRLDFIANGQVYIDMLGGVNSHTSITSCFLSKGRTDGWVGMSLQNGFTNYGGEYSGARYNLLESGEVFIEGLINTGTNVNYNRVFDYSAISPLNTNIMVAGIKGGSNKDGNHGNLEHYPDGKAAILWPVNNWHSIVHNYIKDTGTVNQSITYYVDYRFKPIGGAYGEWTRHVNGHGSTSIDISLSSFGNGHIQFRVLASDGVENSSAWQESTEVRVLKYTAPTFSATSEKALAHEINFVKLEINKLATSLGTAQASASTNISDIISKAGITSMRSAINSAASTVGKAGVTDTNLDVIRKSDIDNLKNVLKSI